jgi:hypothetical protein
MLQRGGGDAQFGEAAKAHGTSAVSGTRTGQELGDQVQSVWKKSGCGAHGRLQSLRVNDGQGQ